MRKSWNIIRATVLAFHKSPSLRGAGPSNPATYPLGRGHGLSTSLKLLGASDNSDARPFLRALGIATEIIREDVYADIKAARAGDRCKEINRLNKLMARLTRQSLELCVMGTK